MILPTRQVARKADGSLELENDFIYDEGLIVFSSNLFEAAKSLFIL